MWKIDITMGDDGEVIQITLDVPDWMKAYEDEVATGIVDALKFAVPEWHNTVANFMFVPESTEAQS